MSEEQVYSDREIRQEALDYVKYNKPKEYREMKKNGELEEYLNHKVEVVKHEVETNMQMGISPIEAWHTAVRQVLLERE